MSRLLTRADLEQPAEQKKELIELVMQLGELYDEFKAQDGGEAHYAINTGNDRDRTGGIHASEISHCQKLLVYSLLNTERRTVVGADSNPNMRMRFQLGHAVHAMQQDDFVRFCAWLGPAKGIFVMFQAEARISPELGGDAALWDLHSSCDGIFTFYLDCDFAFPFLRLGLEIKTKSGPEYEKLKVPEPEHHEQTCLYMAALDLPLMWLFYYNKSNSNFTKPSPPFLFQFDKHLWENKLEVRFAHAMHLAETGVLPPREEGMHCRWCPFAWTCSPPSVKVSKYQPSSTSFKPGAFRLPVTR